MSGDAGTTGLYHVQVILNAAVENESHDGATNDTADTAQSLEPSFLPLNGSVNDPPRWIFRRTRRRAGPTDAATPDYYAFSLAKGESATLALTGLSSGDLTLTLEDSTGTTLAMGRAGSTNLSQVIDNFVATKQWYLLRAGQRQRLRRHGLQPGRHPQCGLRHRSERLVRHGPGPCEFPGGREALGPGGHRANRYLRRLGPELQLRGHQRDRPRDLAGL